MPSEPHLPVHIRQLAKKLRTAREERLRLKKIVLPDMARSKPAKFGEFSQRVRATSDSLLDLILIHDTALE